ncbi:MAG: ribonuclease III [Alphaproteobacteria bacterium RIFCSPHIGHO2_12_FULL_66_14]|nr:MAG: ribonuclease III [Alphaproteobacteria bacterium RIFCSPHIGHO2_12_FULL_66_14]
MNATDVDLEALAGKIGHTFGRAELAAEALTHRGALDRRSDLKAAFPHGNERLEFLGDRVLSLAVADLLLRRFPQEHEGELARRHAALVRAETLVEIATTIGLGGDIRLGDSERGQGEAVRPTILADALEALLGAVFLDAGFAVSAACVERLWGDRLTNQAAAPRDPKTALQEWAQARRLPLPAYREVGREGPPHAPLFVVDVAIKGHEPAQARGGSKREAERLAAIALLERLSK